MIREIIRKFVGDSGESGLTTPYEVKQPVREAMVFNYVGGLKIQCPDCSNLMNVDTTMTCENCRATHQLQTVTISPGFPERHLQEKD